MKYGWAVLLLLAGLCVPVARAQDVAVYGAFGAERFHNLVSDNWMYGGVAGALVEKTHPTHHVTLGGDVRVGSEAGAGEQFTSAAVGVRGSLKTKRFMGLSPYAEFGFGFARFNGNAFDRVQPGRGYSDDTTDALLVFNGGVAKKISSKLDVTAEYGYMQYYAYGGQYNPKSIRLGVMYHFRAR